MKSVIRWAVSNSPAMNTAMVGILLVGSLSLATMRREVFPEFELEIILITVPYPGASPEEVEDGICRKIEEAVRSVSGIKKQTSIAAEGTGSVVLELEADVPDVQKILNEVRSEIDRIPSFPELAEDPESRQITFRQPAIRLGVVGPDRNDAASELKLRDLAERIRNDLLQLPAVSQVNLVGTKDYQIDVEIPEPTLRKHGLTLQQVAETIRRENIELPGGKLNSDSHVLLLRGKNKQLFGDEIARIPVVTSPEGVVLTIGDLGTVRDEFTDVTAVNRINGRPGVVLSIDRTSEEDLLKIVEEVRGYCEKQKAELPAGYELETWQDVSADVRDRMDLLVRNGLQGLALVMIVLAVFLEIRLAYWVAMGIPIAVLGAGAVLLMFGQTLNMLTMFAFLMALGIVVDDAIVIGENIYAHRQRGSGPIEAAVHGAVEVLPSVAASVSTTIVAFTPLMFVAGIMGKFVGVLPVAVISMLVISLVESTFILPCHLAHTGEQHSGLREFRDRLTGVSRWSIGLLILVVLLLKDGLLVPFRILVAVSTWVNRQSARVLDFLIRAGYRPALRVALRNPAAVIASAVSLLLVSVGFVQAGITPFVVFPKLDNKIVEAKVIYPDGTPSHVTDRATRRLEEAILEIADDKAKNGQTLVEVVHRAVGEVAMPSGANDARVNGSHVGAVVVELVPVSERNLTSQEVIAAWRIEADEFAGVEELRFGSPRMGPGGTPVEFKLLADSSRMDALEEAVEKCKARLAEEPGVIDIADDSRPGKWEFRIKVKQQARAMGVPLSDLAETVRSSYYGAEAMRLQRGRHEVKLMVRYPRDDRESIANFDDIRVRTGDRSERPITELADVKVERGYSEINRVDQLRAITITADIDENNPQANAQNTVDRLRAGFMPGLLDEYPGLSVRWEGQQEQTQESMESLLQGFQVALVVMYMLLTIVFRSYVQPLIILAIIPFGGVGAIGGHALLGMPLTLFSVFGLVALTGVVVNDSIVLIDFINRRVAAGVEVREALLDAGCRRFRPVLLTSFTTIAGLTPILMEKSFQAQILIPMACSLVFGLMLATLLVLFVVPVFYSIYAMFARHETATIHSTATTAQAERRSAASSSPVADRK